MRRLVVVALALCAGIFAGSAGAGALGSGWAGVLVGLAVAATLGRWLAGSAWLVIEPEACPPWLRVVAALGTVAALAQLGRLAVFMADPAQVACSSIPGSAWERQHSCTTAYYVAAQAISEGRDVYDDSLYNAPEDDPTKPRRARKLDGFNVDVYEYPPPFLLMPRALLVVAPDFLPFRALWFGLSGLFGLACFGLVASALGATAGTRAWLLAPLVWLAIPTLSALQKGNLQAGVLCASMAAMVLFERRRHALGGALLAFSGVSKLYPGLLLVYLLVRREWRALGWTIGFGLVFIAASLLDPGLPTWQGFFGHLPGLMSGEAFPAFRSPSAMAINLSIPGLVFKAKLFGVPGMGFPAAKVVGWVYTLAALGAAFWASRRPWADVDKPLLWLGILILATLRSPFLPQAYGAFPGLWMVTLLGAVVVLPSWRSALPVLLAWAGLNVFWPTDWPHDPRMLALVNLIPQGLTVALAVVALRWRGRTDGP